MDSLHSTDDDADVVSRWALPANLLRLAWLARRGDAAPALGRLTASMLAEQERLGVCLNDLPYGLHDRQRADVYLPPDVCTRPVHGWPMVVFFPGGSWQSGSRAEHAFVGASLAARGVIAVIADYRLHPEVVYPAFLEDSAQAVAWACRQRRDWQVDPTRCFVMGHSAGAYNAAMVALDERWLRAQDASTSWLAGWIGLAGPYNFWPVTVPELKPVFAGTQAQADSQPVAHVRSDAPPSWLLTAPSDKWVSPDLNSRALYRRLTVAGAHCAWRHVPRTGHISLLASLAFPLQAWAPVMTHVMQVIQGEGWGDQTSTVNSGSQPSGSPLWE